MMKRLELIDSILHPKAHLKSCGLGQSSVVEPILQTQADKLVSWLHDQSKLGPLINVRHRFVETALTMFWKIITGNTSGGEEISKLMVGWFDALQRVTNSGLMFFPWLKHIVPEWSGQNFSKKVNAEIDAKLKETFNRLGNGEANLFAAYQDHWKSCDNPESSFYKKKGWRHAFYSVKVAMLGAGETSGSVLSWMLNYLTAYPNVQEKFHCEIQNVLGSGDLPKLSDKSRMPYMEATVLETLRMASFMPFRLIYRLLEDVQVEGYNLPKNMLLISNMYYVHYDKRIWGDPQTFRPDRFLEGTDEERKARREHVIPFQPGKRLCPGEGLAKDELFILGARLVQKLKFWRLPGKKEHDYLTPIVGYNLMLPQTGFLIKPRE